MTVSVEVPNLTGGVSQQPPKNRLPGKVEAADDVWLSPALGAVRRPPSFLVAQTWSGSAPPDRRLIPIDLNGEVYFALVREEEVLVWDSDGNPVDVVSPIGLAHDLRPLDRQAYGVDYLGSPREVTETWTFNPANGSFDYSPLGSTTIDGPFTAAIYSEFIQVTVFNTKTLTVSRVLDPRPPTKAGHRVEMFVLSDAAAVWPPPDDIRLDFEFRDELDAIDVIQVRFDWDGADWTVGSADAEVSASVLEIGANWWRLRADVTPNATYRELSKYTMVVQATPDAISNRAFTLWGFRDSEFNAAASALDPQTDLAAITVQDFTFLLNKRKRVVERGALAEETLTSNFYVGDDPAFVGVRGFPDTTFTVRWQTSADAAAQEVSQLTGPAAPDSESLAATLEGLINAAAGTTISALAAGSTLLLDPGAGETFLILEVRDTQANTVLTLVWREVDSVSDLPLTAPDGFVVRIAGSPGSALDDHYAVFERSSDASDVAEALEAGEGFWRETIAPGTPLGLDSLTLPYQLVRRFDDAFGTITGTAFAPYFEWGPVDWADRLVGDVETNLAPAFVGRKLTALAFHRNRFVLAAEEQISLSEAGGYFNFFRTTVTALVDSDPVEVAASHTERSDTRQLLSQDEALLVFSDETVFALTSGGGPLTPQTATIRPILRLTAERDAQPINYQNAAIAAGKAVPNGSLHTVFQRDIDLWDTSDLTREVPSYLDSGVLQLVSASQAGFIAARTADRLRVWFSYRDAEGKTVQAAWTSWNPQVDRVAGLAVVDADLWLLVDDDDQQLLLRLPLDPVYVETGEAWAIYLDARCVPTASVYDAMADETTYTLPRDVLAEDLVVDSGNANVLDVVSRTGDEIVVSGEGPAEADVTVGAPINSSLVLTPPYPKLPSQLGGLSARRGRFQISFLRVDVEDTNHFRCSINSTGRAERSADFQAPLVLGQIPLADGYLRVLVSSNPDDGLEVALRSVGVTPFRLVAASWEGEFYAGNSLFGTA